MTHPAPYGDVAISHPDPEELVHTIYQQLLEVRPFFPGDTNVTGHCIDSLLERLEMMGAKRDFEMD